MWKVKSKNYFQSQFCHMESTQAYGNPASVFYSPHQRKCKILFIFTSYLLTKVNLSLSSLQDSNSIQHLKSILKLYGNSFYFSSILHVFSQGLLISCNQMSADYLFQTDKCYDCSYDTGDKVIQCGRHNDIFKLWLQWRARVG